MSDHDRIISYLLGIMDAAMPDFREHGDNGVVTAEARGVDLLLTIRWSVPFSVLVNLSHFIGSQDFDIEGDTIRKSFGCDCCEDIETACIFVTFRNVIAAE